MLYDASGSGDRKSKGRKIPVWIHNSFELLQLVQSVAEG
jgi:hypothetical protein